MKILLIAATELEIAPTRKQLQRHFTELAPGQFVQGQFEVELLITGVGLPLTAYALGWQLARYQYDLLIQAGVAGAIDRTLALGDVVEVISDCFADIGVEERDGSFTAATSMGLVPLNEPPFQQGRLWNAVEETRSFLPQVHGISVNIVHGAARSIAVLKAQYPFAQVESMEGAAFLLASLKTGSRCLQIRSISNYVEPRQRENWKLTEAVTNLNEVVWNILNLMSI